MSKSQSTSAGRQTTLLDDIRQKKRDRTSMNSTKLVVSPYLPFCTSPPDISFRLEDSDLEETSSVRRSGRRRREPKRSLTPIEIDPIPADQLCVLTMTSFGTRQKLRCLRRVLVWPHEGGPGSVSILHGDQKRLADGEFLNDTLIDYGLKFAAFRCWPCTFSNLCCADVSSALCETVTLYWWRKYTSSTHSSTRSFLLQNLAESRTFTVLWHSNASLINHIAAETPMHTLPSANGLQRSNSSRKTTSSYPSTRSTAALYLRVVPDANGDAAFIGTLPLSSIRRLFFSHHRLTRTARLATHARLRLQILGPLSRPGVATFLRKRSPWPPAIQQRTRMLCFFPRLPMRRARPAKNKPRLHH